jgi:hypothetical protein
MRLYDPNESDLVGEVEEETHPLETSGPRKCRKCSRPLTDEESTFFYGTAKEEHVIEIHICPECQKLVPPIPWDNPVLGYRYQYCPIEKYNSLKEIYRMSNERLHAEHSPSSLEYKSKCPGFRNDQTRDKTAAHIGEFLHLCVEKENLDLTPPTGVEYDDFGRKAAELCIGYINSLRAAYPKREEHKEPKLEMLGQWGYADMVILHGDEAELIDFKFAWNAYPAEGFQFKAYSVGVVERWPFVKKITIRVLHPFLDLIDTCVYKTEDFDRLRDECGQVIALAGRNDPSTFRTGHYCTYCGVKATCPKLGETALVIGQKYQPEELVIPDELVPENISDPQMVARGLIIAPIMEEWCRKIKARGLEMRMQEGIEVPGFELCERSAAFSITDAQAAWEVVKDKISPEEYAGCATVKIGALEKVFAEKFGRGEKAKAKSMLRDLLTDADAAKSEGVVHFLKRQKPSIKDRE